jgi:hypothetical protein
MIPWVLIIWFAGSQTAITTHEFLSKEACDNAGKVIKEKGGKRMEIGFACVPKDLLHAIQP